MSTKVSRVGMISFEPAIVGQHVEPRVGHRDVADIRLDRAERIVRRLRGRGLRQRIEERRLADIRQADDAAFEAHGGDLISELFVMEAGLCGPRRQKARAAPRRLDQARARRLKTRVMKAVAKRGVSRFRSRNRNEAGHYDAGEENADHIVLAQKPRVRLRNMTHRGEVEIFASQQIAIEDEEGQETDPGKERQRQHDDADQKGENAKPDPHDDGGPERNRAAEGALGSISRSTSSEISSTKKPATSDVTGAASNTMPTTTPSARRIEIKAPSRCGPT